MQRIKDQLKGNLILSLERSSSWMNWLGRSLLYFNDIRTVDDIVDQIDSVSIDDIQSISQDIFSAPKMSLAAIGPFSDADKLLNKATIDQFSEDYGFSLSE